MIRKHLDLNSVMIGNKVTFLFDGMRDGRTYLMPKDKLQDARLVLKREAPLAVNQMVAYLEHHNCRVS